MKIVVIDILLGTKGKKMNTELTSMADRPYETVEEQLVNTSIEVQEVYNQRRVSILPPGNPQSNHERGEKISHKFAGSLPQISHIAYICIIFKACCGYISAMFFRLSVACCNARGICKFSVSLRVHNGNNNLIV